MLGMRSKSRENEIDTALTDLDVTQGKDSPDFYDFNISSRSEARFDSLARLVPPPA